MRRAVLRARRGATLPFVCIMLTALIGAMALAVDLGRLYYSAAEVQTAADAAALAAARRQQYYPTSGFSGVQSSAQWLAGLNRSGGQPVQVLSADVVPVTYNPTTRAIGATTYSSDTYAFTVTAQTVVPSIISGGAHTVRRSATAWVANVNGGSCVRPIAINYTRFYEAGVTHDSSYSSVGAFAPDFNFWDIANTQYANLKQRTFIVLPPGAKWGYWLAQHPDSAYANGAGGFVSHANWEPVDFTGGGLYPFAYALGGPEGSAYCSGNKTAVGDVKQPLISSAPADSANLIYAANQAMLYLCNRSGNAPNAFCYNANGTVGVKTRIMLTDSVNSNGVWTHKVREVGVARIMCYFQSTDDICNPQPMNEPPATVGTWTSWGPLKGYPPGSVMILLDTPGSTAITPDMVLGTKFGLTQRVLLAK